jgi:hypothetical protein
MSTQPNPLLANTPAPSEDEPRLSYDEGWDLIFSLFGTAKEVYAEVGGSDAFMRAERASWGDDEEAPL